MVKLEIFGLALDESGRSPIIVLKDDSDSVVLPIWIGAVEAMAISTAINKVPFSRPMTHDLLLNLIEKLDASVNRVEVTDIENGTFFAEIVLDVKGEIRRVDSRPSDAIALAVRVQCPIFAGDDVIKEAGVPYPEHTQSVIKTDEADKWQEELSRLSEEDTKYKM